MTSLGSDKLMRLLFMNGRHWKIMLLITMVSFKGPGCTQILITLCSPAGLHHKSQEFTTITLVCSFPTFLPNYGQWLENYECLVITNNIKSNKLEEQIFLDKASDTAISSCDKK